MRLFALMIALNLSFSVSAEISPDNAGTVFVQAVNAFENDQYERAVALFNAVLSVQPDCARCAHLLGKSYGSLAEQATFGKAIGLAKKTRVALEQAVALAPRDPEPIRDLIKYYRAAPGFLGGSDKKADELERRLRQFEVDLTS